MADLNRISDTDLFCELVARTIAQNRKMIDGGLLALLLRMSEFLSADQRYRLIEALRDVSDEIEHTVMRARAKV
jgi:hypothetical protein